MGISIEVDGSHSMLWRLPVSTTVTSILPFGRLVLVVGDGDGNMAVSVWDTDTIQRVSQFGLLGQDSNSRGERVTHLLPSFDRQGRLTFFAGCESGAVFRFHDGGVEETLPRLVQSGVESAQTNTSRK